MIMGQALLNRDADTGEQPSADFTFAGGGNSKLRLSVSEAVNSYLDQLDGQLGTEVYQMVLAEVEAPLLQAIMEYTNNNQTKASYMLGLNRGTLRKKLKQYGLLRESRE